MIDNLRPLTQEQRQATPQPVLRWYEIFGSAGANSRGTRDGFVGGDRPGGVFTGAGDIRPTAIRKTPSWLRMPFILLESAYSYAPRLHTALPS